jgi:hypothetical protein
MPKRCKVPSRLWRTNHPSTRVQTGCRLGWCIPSQISWCCSNPCDTKPGTWGRATSPRSTSRTGICCNHLHTTFPLPVGSAQLSSNGDGTSTYYTATVVAVPPPVQDLLAINPAYRGQTQLRYICSCHDHWGSCQGVPQEPFSETHRQQSQTICFHCRDQVKTHPLPWRHTASSVGCQAPPPSSRYLGV